ncbi:uncharacterized protein PGTG_08852 [Puccinia graminis f. sp. tritici CRL 75-36-700-3]|uniref:Uncharacterized protein n=1 Tax=Puccinia graminis f. sp. tritici (strain CRL 75-36-700-3 / race SCCL) TaxID=418459 RepID=E3KEC3_PUCGT|nr:uncharacterized protein PGTG_08852 [Puccinia graminis f. sp. tritici CRL 75-36-700-3]EFP82656.1 hypothetical protein PGTG_08852 [Puccinia graminis f. sp. tritici CRL 75-36-700-3]
MQSLSYKSSASQLTQVTAHHRREGRQVLSSYCRTLTLREGFRTNSSGQVDDRLRIPNTNIPSGRGIGVSGVRAQGVSNESSIKFLNYLLSIHWCQPPPETHVKILPIP